MRFARSGRQVRFARAKEILVRTIDGIWTFPFARLELTVKGTELVGIGEKMDEISPPGFLVALGGSAEPSRETTKFTLSGPLRGRTCRFRVDVEATEKGLTGRVLGLGDQGKKGYVIFSPDEGLAEIVELKDDKPSEYYRALGA